jgi:hypothetical protein
METTDLNTGFGGSSPGSRKIPIDVFAGCINGCIMLHPPFLLLHWMNEKHQIQKS